MSHRGMGSEAHRRSRLSDWWDARYLSPRDLWCQYYVHLLKERGPCSRLQLGLYQRTRPAAALHGCPRQVHHLGHTTPVMAQQLSFLFCVCFCFCVLNNFLISCTSTSTVSLSQKSAGSIWRQERKKSIDF